MGTTLNVCDIVPARLVFEAPYINGVHQLCVTTCWAVQVVYFFVKPVGG